jgi:hypothetical protein
MWLCVAGGQLPGGQQVVTWVQAGLGPLERVRAGPPALGRRVAVALSPGGWLLHARPQSSMGAARGFVSSIGSVMMAR